MANQHRKQPTHLVLGGARSGKSAFAETCVTSLAQTLNYQKVYLATAEAFNDEMRERIALHISQRGDQWQTIQEPVSLTQALSDLPKDSVVLIDCLTIWLNNLIHYEKSADTEIAHLCDFLQSPPCPIILVSNEIGLGLVPMDRLSRQFRDLSGRMNQHVAKTVDKVTFVAAGLPLIMKDNTPE